MNSDYQPLFDQGVSPQHFAENPVWFEQCAGCHGVFDPGHDIPCLLQCGDFCCQQCAGYTEAEKSGAEEAERQNRQIERKCPACMKPLKVVKKQFVFYFKIRDNVHKHGPIGPKPDIDNSSQDDTNEDVVKFYDFIVQILSESKSFKNIAGMITFKELMSMCPLFQSFISLSASDEGIGIIINSKLFFYDKIANSPIQSPEFNLKEVGRTVQDNQIVAVDRKIGGK